MTSERARTLLERVNDRFQRDPTDVEPGLDVESGAALQYREACRLLAASESLLAMGQATAAVETAVLALERSIEWALLVLGQLGVDEYVPAGEVVDRGVRAGCYDEAFAERLHSLRRTTRSRAHYREGVATDERARAVYDLAAQVHDDVGHRLDATPPCRCDED